MWTQRINCFPSVSQKLVESFNGGDAVVIINPFKEFTEKEILLSEKYLEDGGKILLIDNIKFNNFNISNKLLKHFGMEYYKTEFCNDSLKYCVIPKDSISFINRYHGGCVLGGDTIMYIEYNNPKVTGKESRAVISSKKIGKGVLVAASCSDIFSDLGMGSSSSLPTKNIYNIYQLEYFLFNEVLKLNKEER